MIEFKDHHFATSNEVLYHQWQLIKQKDNQKYATSADMQYYL